MLIYTSKNTFYFPNDETIFSGFFSQTDLWKWC